ncbi:MAG: pilus assembly protein PilM [Candidatus Aenigmatarchaeota archaeon]
MGRLIAGIDIGSHSIKATIIEAYWKDFKVIEQREEIIVDKAELTHILKNIIPSSFKGEVIVSFPSSHYSQRKITLPFSERKKIEKVLKFEIEDTIPFSAEEIVADFHIIEKTPTGAELLVILTRKSDLKDFLELLNNASINPSMVEAEGLALIHLYQQYPKNDRVSAIIDVGSSKTNILIAFKDSALYTKRIPYGTDSPDLLSKMLLQNIGSFEVKENRTVEKWYIAGGGALDSNFLSVIKNKTGIDLIPADTLTESIKTSKPLSPSMLLSLSLAIKGWRGVLNNGVNLRKEEFRAKKVADLKKSQLFKFAIMGSIVLALAAVDFSLRIYLKSSRYHQLKNHSQLLFKETFADVQKIVNEVEQAKEKLEKIRKKAKDFGIMQNSIRSPLDALREISLSIPEGINLDINEWNWDGETVWMEGKTDTLESLDRIRDGLLKAKGFLDVNITESRASTDKKSVLFKITLRIKGER